MLFGLAADFNQLPVRTRGRPMRGIVGLVAPAGAADYLERHRCRGKDGVSTIERWLERALGQSLPAQSGLEHDVLRAIDEPVSDSRTTAPDQTADRRDGPHRHRVARNSTRRGAGRSSSVARRRPGQRRDHAPRSCLRRGRMADRPLRRVDASPPAGHRRQLREIQRPPHRRHPKCGADVALTRHLLHFRSVWSRSTGGLERCRRRWRGVGRRRSR